MKAFNRTLWNRNYIDFKDHIPATAFNRTLWN